MTPIEERIAKLLRLAGNNPNENEATAAAEKAQALMLQHGIEMGQISLEDGSKIRIDTEVVGGKLDVWRRQLAAAIARSGGGDIVFTREYGKWRGQIEFFGPYGTVKSMVQTYLYLEAQLDRISVIAASNVYHVNAAQSMRWRRSYLYGMSARVCARLDARTAREESSSTALVVVKTAAQRAMEEQYPNLRHESVQPEYDPRAAQEGYTAGGAIALGDDELKDATTRELS